MKAVTQGHRVVALDTCLWIYHIAEHPAYSRLASRILGEVSRGKCRAVASDITLLELLVRPLQMEAQGIANEYEALLTYFPNLELIPVTRDIIFKAARLRANYGLRVPDAIIIGTALAQGATLVITNDAKWKQVEEIKVACLSDFL